MRHHHKSGLLLLALVALVVWWVYRHRAESTAAAGSGAGVSRGTAGGTATTGGVVRPSSVGNLALSAMKRNLSEPQIRQNPFSLDYMHSQDFYTQMLFPFDVDPSTGIGYRTGGSSMGGGGGAGSGGSPVTSVVGFWEITDNHQLVRS